MTKKTTSDADMAALQNPARREFLLNSSAAMVGAPLLGSLLSGQAAAQTREVSFASYGGSYNEAYVSSYAKPFTEKTGISVNVGSGASLALAQLQVASGKAQWDIVELTGPEYQIAVQKDLLLPYDYNIIDASNIPAQFKKSHGIRYAIFMCLMAWDNRKIADADAPKDWVEFWDTKRFPGRRSLYANIGDGGVLEQALLADGVPVSDLYPLDVERALASLDRLGKDNIIWHTTNAEPIQQLVDGQVTLATSWLGRASRAINSGAQISVNPAFGGMTGDYMAVVKTAQHVKEAYELINFTVSNVEANATFVRVSGNAVPNTAVLPLLSDEIVNKLPTSPLIADTVWLKSDEWWSANLESTLIRFKEWQLS